MSTEFTRGPWDPNAQHAGPPGALLARAMETCEPSPGKQIARITTEILRPVPLGRLSVAARVVRPGRSVELLEAESSGDDGPLMLARGWRILTEELELPDHLPSHAAPPGPDQGRPGEFPATDSTGYWTAMDYQFVEGG